MKRVVEFLCYIVQVYDGDVAKNPDTLVRYFSNCLIDVMTKHYKTRQPISSRDELSKEQVDALVDIVYYTCDTLVQHGMSFLDYSELVKEFTEQGRGIVCPSEPQPIPADKLRFLITAILSELLEGVQAEWDFINDQSINNDVAHLKFQHLVIEIATHNINIDVDVLPINTMLAQMFEYVLRELRCEREFDEAFNIVHLANMNKGILVDGKRVFKYKEIGGVKKIIKPDGWEEPNFGNMFVGIKYPKFYTQ
jgi:predicted HAD superfamily Cof-like phosphohydrolase